MSTSIYRRQLPFLHHVAWNIEVSHRVTTLQEKEKTLIGNMQLLPLKVFRTHTKCVSVETQRRQRKLRVSHEEC